MKVFWLGVMLFAAVAVPTRAETPAETLAVMHRVGDWLLAHPGSRVVTDWTRAAGYAGLMALSELPGGDRYRAAMVAMAEATGWQLGPRKNHADDHAIGQTYLELYLHDRQPPRIAPLQKQFDEILASNPGNKWTWCDALFMAPPTWMRLAAATGEAKYRDYAVRNWWLTSDKLYDKEARLYFRDGSYFKKREANGEQIFWSRGNGWVMGGLVRVLQFLPATDPDRARFVQQFREMADRVLTLQQPDGLWRSSLLDPASYPLQETSGSGFFTYALAWGINQGVLDRAKFEPATRRAWTALVACVNPDGKLTHVQPVGADPRKFSPDSTEPYGSGAFLLAGSEIYKLEQSSK